MIDRTVGVPSRRFPPYRQYRDSGVEWLGEIPAHWQSLALGRVTISRCDGPFGSGLKSEHYSESGIRVVRLQNIGWAEFADLDAAYLDEAYARQLGDHGVKGEDILIAGLGDDGHPVGRACVAPVEIEPAMVKADCFRFRLDRRRILPRYAAFQLSATATAVAGRYATGATRARMNLATSASRKITLPPLKEQEAITAFLDRETAKTDALVARKERLVELLQEKRTALITRAVTRGLDPNVPMKDSGVEWLGEIPAHWEVISFGRLIARIEQGWSPVADERLAAEDEWGVIKLSAVNKGSFREDEHKALPSDVCADARYEIRKDDFLLSRSNTPDLVGDVCVVGAVRERLMLCDLVYRLDLIGERAHRHFLGYWFLSQIGRHQIRIEARGSSQSMVKVSQGIIRAWTVAIPPLDEQRVVSLFLDRKTAGIDALIAKIHEAIDRLREFRTALISAAVTGKIDVRQAVRG